MEMTVEDFMALPLAKALFQPLSLADMNEDEVVEHKSKQAKREKELAEEDELDLFQYQEGFRLEERRLQENFDAMIQKMKKDFVNQVEKMRDDRVAAFRTSLKDKGIQSTERETVPAYKFRRFLELPFEIRNRIWSMAIRIASPRHRYIMDMKTDSDNQFRNSTQSSRVFGHDSYHIWPINALRACRESRMVGMKIVNLMPVQLVNGYWQHNPARWANVVYDTFYMIGSQWNRFKVLVDIFNAITTPSPPLVQKGLDAFANIRLLNLELRMFATAPPVVWTHFTRLEILTIGIWPLQTIAEEEYEDEHDYFNEDIRFLKILKGGSYQRRAQWLSQAITKRLAYTKTNNLGWRLPTVHVGIISDGAKVSVETYGEGWYKSRYYTDSSWNISAEDFINGDEFASDKSTIEIPESDSEWYQEASTMLEENSPRWKMGLEIANKIVSRFVENGPTDRDSNEIEDGFSDIEADVAWDLGYEVVDSDDDSNQGEESDGEDAASSQDTEASVDDE